MKRLLVCLLLVGVVGCDDSPQSEQPADQLAEINDDLRGNDQQRIIALEEKLAAVELAAVEKSAAEKAAAVKAAAERAELEKRLVVAEKATAERAELEKRLVAAEKTAKEKAAEVRQEAFIARIRAEAEADELRDLGLTPNQGKPPRFGKIPIRTIAVGELGPGSVALSHDGTMVVSATDTIRSVNRADKNDKRVERAGEIILWNVATGKLLHTIKGIDPKAKEEIYDVAFSGDDQLFGTLGTSGLNYYGPDGKYGKRLLAYYFETETGKRVMKDHEPLEGKIRFKRYSPDLKRRLAFSGGNLIIKEVASSTRSATEIRTIPYSQTGGTSSGCFGPAGRLIATCSVSNRLVKIFGVETKTLNHSVEVWSVAFSPDGKQVVTGCENGIIKIWDIVTGKELQSLTHNEYCVYCVAYSGDGNRIVSSGSKTVKIWGVAVPP